MNNKFKRLLSILLSICLVFSLATVYTSAEETVDEVKTGNYYVRSNGYDVDDSAETTVNGDGRTANTPAPTVAAVIDTIIADGFNANDTANVYILQDEDGATKFSGTATSNNYAKHNMTAWSDTGTTPTAWTFTLVVKSPEDEQNYLAFSSYVGYAANMYINGPTVIENVTLIATRTYTDRRIVTNGYNVTLSDTTKFRAIDKKDASAGLTWDGTIKGWYIPVQISGTKGAEFSSPMTITLNNVYSNSGGTARRLGLHLPSGEGVANTFKEDVNIIIDNESATWPITFGGNTSSTSGKFEKTLNVNIKAAAAITESNGESNNGATGSITVTEGLQIIYPSATTVPDFAATLKTKGVENYWILENTTANEDLLTFATDENGDVVAGTYNVANGYAVTATGTNGTYTSSGSVLKIENPGTYTLTATASKDYYVRSTGYEKDNTTAGDGRSANSPAATVADVIATIDEDGLGAGDVANVYILQDSDGATAFDSTKASTYAYNSTTNILKHNMTAWSDVGNTTTTHDFTLVVKSPSGENNYLTFSSYMGVNRTMCLGGPTVFENVTLTAVRNVQDDRLITNGYDVIFGEDTKFAFIKTGSAAVTSVSLNNNGPEGITITNTKDSTFTEDVNITFNNPYDYTASTYDRKTGLHLPSSGSVTGVTFKEDVNVTIDNENAKWAISWFGFTTGATATFEKTVNINVKAAEGIYRSLASGDYSAGTAIVTGGLQIIYPSSTDFEDLTATMTEKSITKYWILENTSNDSDMISFVTDENGDTVAGKYVIAEGVVAVAADADDNVVAVSDDGVLNLSEIPGTYEVRFVEQFDNDGSTITVYEAGEIDLSAVTHNEIDGKVFIGWADKDGNYPEQVDTYAYGDVLYAQYIDYTTADFTVEMTEMRDDSTEDTAAPSLRYVFSENKGLPNVAYRGILMLPITESYGAELYVDEPIVRIWSFDSEAKDNNFTPGTTGATPNSIEVKNILEETEDTLKYTLCLTGMTEAEYDEYYAVRGYIKYQDNNGIDSIFYADQDLTSLYKTVAEADRDTMTDSEKATADAIIEYVEVDRVAEYWTSHGLTEEGYVTETTETQYVDMGCGCFGKEGCTHHLMNIVNENGSFGLRDIFIDTGIEGFEETQIGFITDTHWSYVNKTDIETNHVALSSYRGRGDFRKHTGYYVDRGMMEFASMFGKTVHTGDMMDYFSNGALRLVERLYSKQSVLNRNIRTIVNAGSSVAAIGGSMSATLGNHDPKSLSSNDIKGLTEPLSVAKLHVIIGEKWPNDTTYSSEILLDSEGNQQILNIYLDNSETGAYTEAQYEHLKVDLDYARAQKEAGNELAIFVYQHRPMLTMNPNETEWKYLSGYYNSRLTVPQDNSYYNISEDGTYTVRSDIEAVAKVAGKVPNVVDMTNHSGWSGYGVDPTANDAYNLIRQNADIITAVFCGHIHTNAESTIMGLTADGETTDEYTIPQYTGYLAGYGTVSRIIVK